ncbi:hypothetical protein EK904_003108, partial [Melospiza melodia maxima]
MMKFFDITSEREIFTERQSRLNLHAQQNKGTAKPQMRNLTVDGHFGTWSQWKPCTHTDGASVGSCLCRTRVCDSPAPQCGGWLCEGPTMEIANCSSTTCGIGFQVRQRSCSNPTPRHGGRVCVGQNREERGCGTAMSICCAPFMCFGQAGGHGSAARLSVEEGSRHGAGLVRMALTVLAAA